MMNDTVATKAQDTLTSATSPELAVVIGTRTVGYHQGQRSTAAPKGRTYDRSRPKGSKRKTACQEAVRHMPPPRAAPPLRMRWKPLGSTCSRKRRMNSCG